MPHANLHAGLNTAQSHTCTVIWLCISRQTV